ncbi:hypothetical protein L5515_014627 [Caenorhabditis briggsae]|uniref:Uncharacterized protein n=1 Tax=Caenorhabditis briggsae TaxID=6238 RepID=A0AAE9ECS0_CAEBR|nr:hypothetical protein L5515_014627 [Caenorhabditis briggsae]
MLHIFRSFKPKMYTRSATSQEWLVANDIVNLSYPHRRNDDGRYAEILAERAGDEDSSGSGDDEVGED